MIEGPSRYGGVAAVMVFGVGLLIVGKIMTGLAVLGVGVLALLVMGAPTFAAKVFFLAVGALVCSGAFGYRATSNEITGKATYVQGKAKIVTVTRDDSRSKFREVTNVSWAISGFCLIVSGLGFVYSRKLHDVL
jgi:hypothetical protein